MSTCTKYLHWGRQRQGDKGVDGSSKTEDTLTALGHTCVDMRSKRELQLRLTPTSNQVADSITFFCQEARPEEDQVHSDNPHRVPLIDRVFRYTIPRMH